MERAEPKPTRIAVIAVHGVGEPQPFQTARAIGDLLSDLEQPGRKGTPLYTPFTEVVKRINVSPVEVEHPAAAPPANHWGPLDSIARKAFADREPRPAEGDNTCQSLDHLFMKGQLSGYEGEHPEDTYACMRLEGKRAPDSDQERTVHVYEMFWADLSRVGSAYTRIFGELYQLLFHLGSVSVNNVLAAAIHFQGDEKSRKSWEWFAQFQRWAAGTLAGPVAILNLFLLALTPVILAVSLMRSHLSPPQEFWALDLFTAISFVGVTIFALVTARNFAKWCFFLPILLAACAYPAISKSPPPGADFSEAAVAALVLLAVLSVVAVVIRAYDKQRPGVARRAIELGIILVVLDAVDVVFRLRGGLMNLSLGYPVITVLLDFFEISFLALGLCWIFFYLFAATAHIAGWWAVRSVRESKADYCKGLRTRWTARLILALSATIFISLTMVVWTGIVKMAVSNLPGPHYSTSCCLPDGKLPADSGLCNGNACPPVRYKSLTSILLQGLGRDPIGCGIEYASVWANKRLFAGGLGSLPFYLGALLLAFLAALWGLFPSVWYELNPPLSTDKNRVETTTLGDWLDRGFHLMRWGGGLLYLMLFLTPVFAVTYFVGDVGLFPNLPLPKEILKLLPELDMKASIDVLGGLVGGAAFSALAFSGRLKKAAGGLRPILKVMLDVDNWLREHPLDSNPTARICGRYVSLLRHICAWRDSESDPDSGYDAFVILAYSQGTAITADFLRFLQAERDQKAKKEQYDPALKKFFESNVYLFTMGCPLGQLYGLRFPYLYGWARSEDKDDGLPDHEELGVTEWVNAYRSGDYVGRYLWRGANSNGVSKWDLNRTNLPGRSEFCVGPGAHTHYWDYTGMKIAEELDSLIKNAWCQPRAQ